MMRRTGVVVRKTAVEDRERLKSSLGEEGREGGTETIPLTGQPLHTSCRRREEDRRIGIRGEEEDRRGGEKGERLIFSL